MGLVSNRNAVAVMLVTSQVYTLASHSVWIFFVIKPMRG